MSVKFNMRLARGANYSGEEKALLLRIVNGHLEILANKRNDNASAREKDRAWDEISVDYNANTENYRSKASLKACYENLKKMARKREMDNRPSTQNGPTWPIPINSSRVPREEQDNTDESPSPESDMDPLAESQMERREYIITQDGITMPIDALQPTKSEDWSPYNGETGGDTSLPQERCIATLISPQSPINPDRLGVPPNRSGSNGVCLPIPSNSSIQRQPTRKHFASLAEVKLELLVEDAKRRRIRDDEDYKAKKRVEREEADVRLEILKTELLIKKEILKQEIEKTNSLRKLTYLKDDDSMTS